MKSKILILATTVTAFCLLACNNGTQNSDPEIASLELLRGDILLCGSGDFGEVSFSYSCAYESRVDFNLAISLLHSFEYSEAEKMFAKVIDANPTCAMAYWGVAMCNFHALWRPPTVDDLKKGSLVIKIARSLEDKTQRETEYIEAIGLFFDNWETTDHKDRIAKFERAMEEIYLAYPDDNEAAIFYALALNSAADLSDKTYKNRRKAGEILEGLFPDQPKHPGIAHYIIHSYDYPELANLALSAARDYASIAPASAHAQHMPSHIFTRLGLWDESIESNLKATSAAQCYSEQVEMVGNWDEEIHGVDYLVYAYLQIGEIDEAKKLIEYLLSIEKINPGGLKGAYPTAAIPARFYIETRQWDKAAKLEMNSPDYPSDKFPWPNGIIHFTRILGAVHSGNLEEAKIDLEKLNACHQYLLNTNKDYMADQVDIMKHASEAWILFYQGELEKALTLMKTSAEMEYRTEKHSLTPGEIVPAQEHLGDLLMAMNRPLEALEAYEVDIARHPNRFNGTYGAAKAAQLSGNNDKAKQYFEKLLTLIENPENDRPEVKDAKNFIKTQSI